MSDASGSLVVKPCTRAEIDFYESVQAYHHDLQPFLPTYMGTMQLNEGAADGVPTVAEVPMMVSNAPSNATAADTPGDIDSSDGPLRLHGKKLDTETCIVLENAAYGFAKPNILDIKLGAQLWDDQAPPEKRARLDKVAAETTSSSLGFRIAGMRTWQGPAAPEPADVDPKLTGMVQRDAKGEFWVYNKMYGRWFNAGNVVDALLAYLLPERLPPKRARERAEEVLTCFLDEVQAMLDVLEKKESRMYSASILLVYEGDLDVYEQSKAKLAALPAEPLDHGGEDEDHDEDEALPKLAVTKLIDFAHAAWTPGQGSDENALRGMRSTVQILKDLADAHLEPHDRPSV